MARIIGVRFRHASKMYYFDPNGLDIKYNDAVIVETARGIEYGKVLVAPMSLEDDKIKQPLKPVIRLATEEDTRKAQEYEIKEKEALFICREKIRERELDMKLIAAEYAFDDSKLLFYFTADGRIDFRELVKDLAGIFRRRIELRQIGVRDETKILGGMGVCGRPLCCHTYLSDFAPVSIKMAKEQNLSLNPTKISGCCGRLMCCLNNEAETYCELKKGLPVKGDQATTPEGRHGEVLSVNILRQTVKIVVDMDDDEKDLQEFHVSEISFIPHSKKNKQQQQPKKKTEADKAEGKTAERDHADRPEKADRVKPERVKAEPAEAEDEGLEAPTQPIFENESDEGAREGGEKRRRNRRRRNRREDRGEQAGGENDARHDEATGEGRRADNGEGHEDGERADRPRRRQRPNRRHDNGEAQAEGGQTAGNGADHEGEGSGEGEAVKKKRRRRHRRKKTGEGAPGEGGAAPEKAE